MWFTTNGPLGRIDRNGRISERDFGAIGCCDSRAMAADDAGFWIATERESREIAHVDVDGTVASVAHIPPEEFFEVEGIAEGADGALWFTQASYEERPDAIGRAATDGSYTRWPLPDPTSTPARIAAGPDDALWFTEQVGHRIGRITTKGEITEFPLPLELSPFDITVGRDDALWFTTDTCLGRITTNGRMTLWAVAGAKGLAGIAAAPDGSFWLADGLGHAVRHFTPPKPATASERPCEPPNVKVKAGATRAVVVYKRLDTFDNGEDFFTDIRIRISRKGEEQFAEAVPKYPSSYPGYSVFGDTESVDALDFDADGEPEVMLELNWNGTHCCYWWRVYRFDPKRETYVPITHFWGDAAVKPKLRDLDGDGRTEIVSKDDRFSELTSYAGSFRPIQVWSYDQGKFSEVTRKYPTAIEQDAAELWGLYLKYRAKYSSRYVLAAWAADQYMLGLGSDAEQALAAARARGDLDPHPGVSTDAAAYLTMLRGFLRKTGYIGG